MGRNRSKVTKYVGSCGIYAFVDNGDANPWLLVHRRSKQVSEPDLICSPGGIVERARCVGEEGGLDFGAGARQTAIQELHEETGLELDETALEELTELPVGDGTFWGPVCHRNFCTVFHDFPEVRGPDKSSRHEIKLDGMEGIGRPAGDSYHAWVDLHELLSREDLMPGCRVPLEHVACEGFAGVRPEPLVEDEPLEEKKASPIKRKSPAAPVGHGEKYVKTPRGSISKFLKRGEAVEKAPEGCDTESKKSNQNSQGSNPWSFLSM